MTDEYIKLKIKHYEDEIEKAYSEIYCILMSNGKNINDEKIIILEDFIQIARKNIKKLKNVD